MHSDAILFQTAEQPFFAGETRAKDHFCQNREKFCGRNDAAPEALLESLANRIGLSDQFGGGYEHHLATTVTQSARRLVTQR